MTDLDKEWHIIGNTLTTYLGICSCQRKLKSIVEILLRIKAKLSEYTWSELTSEELLICNLLDSKEDVFTHGSNCEYPIIGSSAIWNYIDTIKDSSALLDN